MTEEIKDYTEDSHRRRHLELHESLDELVADMINHKEMLPSKTTVLELIEWSYQQTIKPTRGLGD